VLVSRSISSLRKKEREREKKITAQLINRFRVISHFARIPISRELLDPTQSRAMNLNFQERAVLSEKKKKKKKKQEVTRKSSD